MPKLLTIIASIFCYAFSLAQAPVQEKSLRYRPSGNDFVISNGTHRFTRALYGSNTGFRVETGDLPEFALYMPGMGGNCKMGIVQNGKSKWLTEATHITATYRAGSMLYEIKDALLGNGSLFLTVLALADTEGVVVKVETKNVAANTTLVIAYGGASGKKFSRDGDIGADPESSFDMKPEYCKDNLYQIQANDFRLHYVFPKTISEAQLNDFRLSGMLPDSVSSKTRQLVGVFPPKATLKIVDAAKQQSPLHLLSTSASTNAPAIVGSLTVSEHDSFYFLIKKPETSTAITYSSLPNIFAEAETERAKLAKRITLQTPDEFINPIGSALAMAANAIWEDPTYLHGAVAWRMRLNAWRGAYCADPLGWHDRAKKHFSSYALSQVQTPTFGPVVPDTALHIARQQEKIGNAIFSEGYICRNPNGDIRPHHYDMNLVFIDQLLNHFNWTGDVSYVKQMWPVITKHLAWEKRNFDADNDGLYDAYACIWASDALQYSGGGVTHSSAYNYRANKTAAQLATLIGEDSSLYEREASKILSALNEKLWLKDKGWFAEYIDLMGLKLVHPSAGLWTVYHAMESGVPTAAQQHQLLRYVDNHIPHIPVRIKELNNEDYYLLATTNWQPYTWSINNVALAENLHTALAYWQGGEGNNAFRLWKSALVESMYLGSSPGNFQQLSDYDVVRGELYRDFADPVGMAARTLVEGLFGILPDALHDKLVIRPGLPASWAFARLKIPDVDFDFKQTPQLSTYQIVPSFPKSLQLVLQLQAKQEKVVSVKVNGKVADWNWIPEAATPMIEIKAGKQQSYTIEVVWGGNIMENKEPVFVFREKIVQPEPLPPMANVTYEIVNLQPFFNDKVTQVFKNKYLSPRPTSPTLQIPWQGIGNWCYPLIEPVIDDRGVRKLAGQKNVIYFNELPFATPSDTTNKNILFTSRWDKYPHTATIPITGKAKSIYLLLAGTTNHQQSRMENAKIVVRYKDGSTDELPLINPQNWWPIEQDYYDDGLAFTTDAPKPYRLILKTGEFTRDFKNYTGIKGFSSRGIDGGAATVLTLPLQTTKELESLTLTTLANEVVAGLMSATLVR